MLNHYREDFSSRLTNNVVENYFGFLKHNLLKRKKMFPSELTAILSKNLIATYIEDYNQNDESCSISVNLNKMKKKVMNLVSVGVMESMIKIPIKVLIISDATYLIKGVICLMK